MHAMRIKMMVSKRKTSKPHSLRVELREISGCTVYLTEGKVLPPLVVCSFPGILTNLSLDPGQPQLLHAQMWLPKLTSGHEKQEVTPTAVIRILRRTYSPH